MGTLCTLSGPSFMYSFSFLRRWSIETKELITWKRTSLLTGLFSVPRQIVAWYYMKFLHLWRGNELFKINFEFMWKKPVTKDHQQVGFIMLNKFWSLTKKPFTLLFLTDNIKLDGMPARIKLKIQACFTLYFKFWEGTLWKVMRYMYQFFYFLFRIRLYISRYHFFTTF